MTAGNRDHNTAIAVTSSSGAPLLGEQLFRVFAADQRENAGKRSVRQHPGSRRAYQRSPLLFTKVGARERELFRGERRQQPFERLFGRVRK